ncbi:ABC transporter substrate-binding protein [Halobellus marinus]|uniref:ABC transporter substrate-binding protein n=1 Tax=Halobellus TaxID=1073986 RepID=UPI0028A71773|nr:ABC transporter substrate-binding protein [Halobellus sp. DFY28]
MSSPTRRSVLKKAGAASVIATTGLAGCSGGGGDSGGDGSDEDSGSGGTTSQDTGPSSLHVGVFNPQTGPFAPWGSSLRTGAELAATDLENEFDIDIEISTYDTEVNPSASLERMKRAVTSDGIDFAQGALSSAVCTKIGTWASDNGVSYIADGASDTLTGENCLPHMFSTYSSNTMLARSIGSRMADIADNWYLLYSDYIWGQNAQEIYINEIEANGGTVVESEATPFPNDDYTSFLNNIQNSEADGIGLVLPALDKRLAMKQLRNKGMHENFKLMGHQAEDIAYWGLNQESAAMMDIASVGWTNSLESAQDFSQRVADEGKTDPFVRHANAYIAMDQQVRAALRAGSTDAEAIRGELEGHTVESQNALDIMPGELEWRACDHQLVHPTWAISGRAMEDMQDDPYNAWFQIEATAAGEDVMRSCEETGCSL